MSVSAPGSATGVRLEVLVPCAIDPPLPCQPRFAVDRRSGLDGITREDWGTLFRGHPDEHALVDHIASCGMDGITLSTIQVRAEDRLVLVVPVFQARFDLSTMIDGTLGRAARACSRALPWLLRPRLLGIGLVEGEWGAVGVAEGFSSRVLDRAWRLADAELRAIGRATRARLTVLLDLAEPTLAAMPRNLLAEFVPVDTSPCAQLNLPYTNVDAYLATLSRSTRQGLRRRVRAAAEHVRIERVTDPSPHLDRMYELYLSTVQRSPTKLGVQSRRYFERLCTAVPGAHVVLYFAGEELLAFNTLIERPGMLVDKYFCMDVDAGRRHSLYFVSWMENVRYAISRRIPMYHAGAGAEETKRHLGCAFVRTETLFQHANPLVHRVLSFLARTIARRSAAKAEARAAPHGSDAGVP